MGRLSADVLIVGGGIGGLTLALSLHQRGIPCRVFESAPEIQPVGVGVNRDAGVPDVGGAPDVSARLANGAGQAILDAECISVSLSTISPVEDALKDYEKKRLGPTASVVLENRRNPPDAILREVYERTGDRPFADIEAVISRGELEALSNRYKQVAGYDKASLR